MSVFDNRRRRLLVRGGIAVVAAAALSGCGSNNMDDLVQFVQKVHARPAPPVKPIPELKPYATYTYNDARMRSPFAPPTETIRQNVRPDSDRDKEYLERFPLDSLRMVGTISMNGVRYALIKNSDGMIYKVKRGNYLGQNDGRIIKIGDGGVTLREIVPNGLGGYAKRQTHMVLATQAKAEKS